MDDRKYCILTAENLFLLMCFRILQHRIHLISLRIPKWLFSDLIVQCRPKHKLLLSHRIF